MRGFLVDTSVWVAAFFEQHEFFAEASAFIASCTSATPALFCRATEQSWLRLTSTPTLHTLYHTPTLTNSDAVHALANWRGHPHIDCIETEPDGTRDLWLKLAAVPCASPKTWMDAYLAAFAIRARLPFVTFDADFRRFEPDGLALRSLPFP